LTISSKMDLLLRGGEGRTADYIAKAQKTKRVVKACSVLQSGYGELGAGGGVAAKK